MHEIPPVKNVAMRKISNSNLQCIGKNRLGSSSIWDSLL